MRNLEQFEKTYIAQTIESKLQVQDVEIGDLRESAFPNQPSAVSISFVPIRDKRLATTIGLSVQGYAKDVVSCVIERSLSAVADYLKDMYVYKHRGGKENG